MTASDRTERIDREAIDAVKSLGNRQRFRILLALAEAERERRRQWNSLSFTELYNAVDIGSSSQFSYHLQRLVGQFVAETSDGYRLTYSGNKIVRMLLSGAYESAAPFEARDVDGVCPICESTSLAATLTDGQFVVRCTECDSTLVVDFLPQSQSRGRTPSEVVESVGSRIWSVYAQLQGDVCPECYGRVDTTVDSHERGEKTFHTYASSCRECWFVVHVPVEVAAAFHPAARYLFWKHGVSLREIPLWEFFEYVVSDTIATEMVSDEPVEFAVEISLCDETVRLTLDDSPAVTAASREFE